MKADDLIKTLYGTSHGGAQKFSRLNGRDYEWNFVAKKGSTHVVVVDQSDADAVAWNRKILPITKPVKASNPDFLQEVLEYLRTAGSRQAYLDKKLKCVSLDVSTKKTLQVFEGAKPGTVEVWIWQPPKANQQMLLTGPKVTKYDGLIPLLINLGAKF